MTESNKHVHEMVPDKEKRSTSDPGNESTEQSHQPDIENVPNIPYGISNV